MTITSTHAKADLIRDTFDQIQHVFNSLKAIAPQLSVVPHSKRGDEEISWWNDSSTAR